MVYILIDLEFFRVINGHFYPQAAEFIIYLDTVGLRFEFDPPALRELTVIGDRFSLMWKRTDGYVL